MTGQNFHDMGAKSGDVVRCVNDHGIVWWTKGKEYTVNQDGSITNDNEGRHLDSVALFEFVSRASDTPVPLKDMPDEEAGNLWVAWSRGEDLEIWLCGEWVARNNYDPMKQKAAYRLAPPKPVRGTVTLYGSVHGMGWSDTKISVAAHCLTIPTIDGKMIYGVFRDEDGNEIRMEKLT